MHHPIDYNMSMNDPREIQKRLFKYFVPVLLLSVAFNIPKVNSIKWRSDTSTHVHTEK